VPQEDPSNVRQPDPRCFKFILAMQPLEGGEQLADQTLSSGELASFST